MSSTAMEIVVQIEAGERGLRALLAARAVAAELGFALLPAHPAGSGTELERFHRAEVADATAAARALDAFRSIEGIAAAYHKPAAEPP